MGEARRKRAEFGNRIPATERILGVVVAFVSLAVAWDLVLAGRLTFVGHHRNGWLRQLFGRELKPDVIVVLDGWPVFWAYLVLALVALMALSFVIDHYDRRFNASFYVKLRHTMLVMTGIVVAGGSIAAMMQISSH